METDRQRQDRLVLIDGQFFRDQARDGARRFFLPITAAFRLTRWIAIGRRP